MPDMTPEQALQAVAEAGLHREAACLREAVANPMAPVVNALLRANEQHSERTNEAITSGMAGMSASITSGYKSTASAINRATIITSGIVLAAMMLVAAGAMGVSSIFSDGSGRSFGVTAPAEAATSE